MKKNIAIVAGGDSGEFEVSVKSAEMLIRHIDRKLFSPYLIYIKGTSWRCILGNEKIPVDKNNFSVTVNNEKIKFECILIAIHGTPGEDGKLQSYFEMLNIPYTTCGVLSSALTFNKYACKQFLSAQGIFIGKSDSGKWKDRIDEQFIATHLEFPCFVKPNNGGSSCGISKVNDISGLQDAFENALEHDEEVLFESFIDGTEITCSIVKTGNRYMALPMAEIVSKKEFFDYEAKYTEGMAEEIIPARISEEIRKECEKTSFLIYEKLFCRGIVRIDFILSNGVLHFLEVNTVPGMSDSSIVPKMILSAGLEIKAIITELIEDSITN